MPKLDCKQSQLQSLIILCNVTARETQAREQQSNITSWFATTLAEIRTRRILREKADCEQSMPRPSNVAPSTTLQTDFTRV